MDTVILTNKVAMTLARTHRNGFKVNQDVLESVRKEFESEKIDIEKRLKKQVQDLMGDTPINLNSPNKCLGLYIVESLKIKHYGQTSSYLYG